MGGYYLSAKTEQALNNSPGPSLREKTTEVLHIRVSEGDCKERPILRGILSCKFDFCPDPLILWHETNPRADIAASMLLNPPKPTFKGQFSSSTVHGLVLIFE